MLHLTIRRAAISALTVAGLVAGAAACGTADDVSAGRSLSDASHALVDSRALTTEIGLDLSADDRAALAAAIAGRGLDARTAADLTRLTLAVTVAAPEGRTVADVRSEGGSASASNGAVALRLGDDTLAEIRYVDGAGFVRVDVPTLRRLAPVDEALSGLSASAALIDPRLAEAVDAVVEGKWATFPAAELSKQLQQCEGRPGSGQSDAADQAGAAKKLSSFVDSAKAVLTREVTIERDGDTYTATASLERIVGGLAQAATAVYPGAAMATGPLAGVSSKKVTVEFVVKDGVLRSARTDLLSLADGTQTRPIPGLRHLPLKVTFTPGDAVSKPEGAVTVDLRALMARAAPYGAAGIPGLGGCP